MGGVAKWQRPFSPHSPTRAHKYTWAVVWQGMDLSRKERANGKNRHSVPAQLGAMSLSVVWGSHVPWRCMSGHIPVYARLQHFSIVQVPATRARCSYSYSGTAAEWYRNEMFQRQRTNIVSVARKTKANSTARRLGVRPPRSNLPKIRSSPLLSRKGQRPPDKIGRAHV